MCSSPLPDRRALDDFWQALVACEGRVPELLRIIADQVIDVVGEGCVVTTVDPTGRELRPAVVRHRDVGVSRAMKEAIGDRTVGIGEGLVGTAAAERRSLVLNDISVDAMRDAIASRYAPFTQAHRIRSMVLVPMLAGGQLLGTLGAIRTSNTEPYTAADLRVMEALAERAALAIADTMAGPRRIGSDDYEALFRYSIDGLLITTPDGRILAANPAMCAMLGTTERQLTDGGRDTVVVADDPRLTRALAERAAAGKTRAELTLRRDDGSTFEADVTSTVYTTEDGRTRTCMVVRDIDEEARRRELAAARLLELEELVDRDPATGLWNRRGLVAAAHQAFARADRERLHSQVVFVDLDGLKALNDTRGHAAGDAAITALSDAMRHVARESDVTCRIGGDEFLVIMIDAGPDDTASFVERLRARLRDDSGTPAGLTFTAGHASRAPGSTRSLSELIEEADRDLYAHKVLQRRREDPDRP